MRYRIATAASARVLPTLDGPLAVEAGETVLVVVLPDEDAALRLAQAIDAADNVRRKIRGRR